MPTFRGVSLLVRGPQQNSVGEQARRIHVPVAQAMVDCGICVDGRRLSDEYTFVGAVAKVHQLEQEGNDAFAWVSLHDPDDHQMKLVAEAFGLDELGVENALRRHQRPKLERYDEALLLVLKTVKYVENETIANAREIVETGEIIMFVGADFVVTVGRGEHSEVGEVRRRLEASPAALKLGPYAVMHTIADHVVDSYLDVADHIQTDIYAIEEDIFSPRKKSDIESIYLLKREVVELRRAVSPLTVALERLDADHSDLISAEVRRYMRDVLDRNTSASDQINSYDDLVSSLVQAALGSVAMQQNVDMRKISAWVAIAAVPTAVAGIYGMNFEHMPELKQGWAYPAVLSIILVVCVLLYGTFRRNRWL